MHTETSDEIAWHCECYAGRGVMQFDESGATLAVNLGVLVSKMWEPIEPVIQASWKTARIPMEPYPVYPSGKSWDEVPGKVSSGKKFFHNAISGADFAAQLWPRIFQWT